MDDPADEFFRRMGMCFAQWAIVEQFLVATCWKCLNTHLDLASIVYFSTGQLDRRITLVDELVRATLPRRSRKDGGHDHADVRKWEAVREEIRDLLKIRNRIAHHPVTSSIPDQSNPDRTRLQIEQSFAEGMRPFRTAPEPLFQDDLEQHLIKVQSAVKSLVVFYEDVLPKHLRRSP